MLSIVQNVRRECDKSKVHGEEIVHAIVDLAYTKKPNLDATSVLKKIMTDNVSYGIMNEDIIRALFAKGADINISALDGTTPLLQIVNVIFRTRDEKLLPFIEFLSRAGANMDASRHNESTSLYLTAGALHVPATRTLLANGADGDAKVFDGATPLHWLIHRVSEQGLNDHYAEALISNNSCEILKLLAESRVDVNSASHICGDTTLHMIIDDEKSLKLFLDLTRLLLDIGGADVNARNNEGYTPLQIAMDRNEYRYILMLLERGADPSMLQEELYDIEI